MDPSPFPQKKRAGLHAHYGSLTAAAFVRCHEVEQMARLPFPAGLPPCHTTHPTPSAGGEGGEEGGQRGGEEAGTEDLTGASDPST